MRNSILPAVALAVLLLGAGAFSVWFLMGQESNDQGPVIDLEVSKSDELERNLKPAEFPIVGPDSPAGPETTRPQSPGDLAAAKAGDATRRPDAAKQQPESTTIQPTEIPPLIAEAVPGNPRIIQADEIRAQLQDINKVPFSATISGRVTDSANLPVAGATVHYSLIEMNEVNVSGRAIRMALAQPTTDTSSPVGVLGATTDAGGNYTLQISSNVGEKARVTANLTATGDGYAPSLAVGISIANGDSKEGVNLALRGAGSVTGRVVDSYGRGIEGVRVGLQTIGSNTGRWTSYGAGISSPAATGAAGSFAATDSGGNFTLKCSPEGRFKPFVSATGWRQVSGPTEVQVKAGQEVRLVSEIVVTATAQMKVTLKTSDGSTLAGRVSVQFTDQDRRVATKFGHVQADGMLTIDDVPAGTFTVLISFNGYYPVSTNGTFIEGQAIDLGTHIVEKSPSVPAGPSDK